MMGSSAFRLSNVAVSNADRIANRDEIESGTVGDRRDLIVPSDKAHAILSLPLHLLQKRNRDFAVHSCAPVFRKAPS